MNSVAVDDYLKAIYALEQAERPVSTTALAERLGITPASVTSMLKRLAAHDPRLVDYRPYFGAVLTPEGRDQALQIIRHHRLVETFLNQALGYGWDEVHDEADALEHAVSPQLAERLAAALDHPATDPHGEPIPQEDGTMPVANGRRLSALSPGQGGVVCRVASDSPALLRHLDGIGLTLGAEVEVAATVEFSGSLSIKVGPGDSDGREPQFIERWIADAVFVDPSGRPRSRDDSPQPRPRRAGASAPHGSEGNLSGAARGRPRRPARG